MPRAHRRFSPHLILCFLGCCWSLQARGESPAASITEAELRGHVYFLASDALGGRSAGSPGFRVAAEYAESQFRAAGLLPIVQEEGRSTYLQAVPLLRRTARDGMTLTAHTAQGRRSFAHGTDFRWLLGEMLPCERKEIGIVFAGYAISEPALGWDDLRDLDCAGKAVFILTGAPMRDGRPVLPDSVHNRYAPLSAVMKKIYPLLGKRPAAIFVVPNEQIMEAWDALPVATASPQLCYNNTEDAAFHVSCLCATTPAVAEYVFAGQPHAPPGVRGGAAEGVRGFALDNATLTVDASFDQVEVPACNVVGLVEGTDPVLKQQYVVVSAHLDTCAPAADGQVLNGADDDASGCAGVMAVARAVALDPPRRSTIFVLLAAEEGAVAGSRHFLSRCPVPLDKIVADVNLDMIGRSDPSSALDRGHYALDSGKITPEFTRLIKEVNGRTVRWPLKYAYKMGDSDHLVFIAMGIPAVNFYGGHHEDVNQPTDDAEKIDYDKARKISGLVYEVVMEIGNRAYLWKGEG